MSVLSVENLDVRYGQLRAVRDVSLHIDKGDVVALVGANGAGKTTFLRALAGAHKPHGGRILLDGTDVTDMASYKKVRLGLALVPEGRRLFLEMTVEENLQLGMTSGRPGAWTLEKVFETFPFLVPRRHAKAGNLSGGEQQATAIGRALMSNPNIILLDEVSLGLSPLVVEQVYKSLKNLVASETTVVLVEQDLTRAMKTANRVVCMLEGVIVLDLPVTGVTREDVTDAYFGLGEIKSKGGVRR